MPFQSQPLFRTYMDQEGKQQSSLQFAIQMTDPAKINTISCGGNLVNGFEYIINPASYTGPANSAPFRSMVFNLLFPRNTGDTATGALYVESPETGFFIGLSPIYENPSDTELYSLSGVMPIEMAKNGTLRLVKIADTIYGEQIVTGVLHATLFTRPMAAFTQGGIVIATAAAAS